MTKVTLQFTCHQVTNNNTTCFTIDSYYLQHFVTGILCNITQRYLALKSLVSTNQ